MVGLARSIGEMVRVATESRRDDVPATAIRLKALGSMNFAEGHEECSTGALVCPGVGESFTGEAVVFLFLLGNPLRIVAVAHACLNDTVTMAGHAYATGLQPCATPSQTPSRLAVTVGTRDPPPLPPDNLPGPWKE